MNKEGIIKLAVDFTKTAEKNCISQEVALCEGVVGMRIFEEPIFAFGAADDENFLFLKEPEVIGEHILLPKEWMPSAKGVISFFLPFTEKVKKSNAEDMSRPSAEWLHARYEGQGFLIALCKFLQSEIEKAGFKTIVPILDERFLIKNFSSNWSERHIAFALGLGTFGLSKGLITPKGTAGRFGSLITELPFASDKRTYTDTYEYCDMCGVCAKNCPANAITIKDGKDHKICSAFLDIMKEKYKPRYGCGKCQVQVPCESSIPQTVRK